MAKRRTSYNKNNKAAEKWDEETTINKLKEVYKTIENDQTIRFVKTALVKKGVTSRWLSYIQVKFKDNSYIIDLVKLILDVTEARIAEGILDGSLRPQAGMFILRCNYNYIEKTELQTTNENKTDITIKFEPPEKPKSKEEDV